MIDLRFYCARCGSKLVPSYRFSHYNYRNGGKLYEVFLDCPNWKWWDLGHERSARFWGDGRIVTEAELKEAGIWVDG
jgi:hypothetical protein